MNERTLRASRIQKLEDPERLKWLPPEEALRKLGLEPGQVIADIGAGTGFFALPFARAVAPTGRVLAVDFQPEMLAALRQKLEGPDAPANIELIRADAADTTLPAETCDIAFLGTLWHELDDHAAVLAEMARILKPEGRVAILDWSPEAPPPPGPPVNHRISQAQVAAQLERAGWRAIGAGPFGAYAHLVTAVRPRN